MATSSFHVSSRKRRNIANQAVTLTSLVTKDLPLVRIMEAVTPSWQPDAKACTALARRSEAVQDKPKRLVEVSFDTDSHGLSMIRR